MGQECSALETCNDEAVISMMTAVEEQPSAPAAAHVDGLSAMHRDVDGGNEEQGDESPSHAMTETEGSTAAASPLHRAALLNEAEECLQLIRSRADVNATDSLGRTPLHAAAYAGSVDAAQVLVKFGGDISCITKQGKTPMIFAAEQRKTEMMKFLISLASPPQKSNKLNGWKRSSFRGRTSQAASSPASPLSQRGSSGTEREEFTSRTVTLSPPSKLSSPTPGSVHYNLYTPARSSLKF